MSSRASKDQALILSLREDEAASSGCCMVWAAGISGLLFGDFKGDLYHMDWWRQKLTAVGGIDETDVVGRLTMSGHECDDAKPRRAPNIKSARRSRNPERAVKRPRWKF